ncbi:hypothetical protein FACS189444_1780 [Spirochaetia bacterium]|nr:hypothetical protein FACS189444_1780 [Spirochaetia bacterium]
MSDPSYVPVFYDDGGQTLRRGNSAVFVFRGDTLPEDSDYQLFVAGETALHYLWKNEPDYPLQYRKPEDALDSVHAWKAPYCVDLSNRKPSDNRADYRKLLYKKVFWPPSHSYVGYTPRDTPWKFGLSAAAKDLRIHPNGYIRMSVEVRLGTDIHRTEGSPDQSAVLDIPGGTYSWQRLSMPLEIPADKTASVGVFIEGYGYEGELYIESPVLESVEGYNFLPELMPSTPGCEKYEWTAMNLSRKEWPELRVALNGTLIHEGEVFERCHRRSEWTVDLGGADILAGENKLTFTVLSDYRSDYRDALPYSIYELGIISVPGGDVQIAAYPESAVSGDIAPVLIRTKKPGIQVSLDCDPGLTAEGSLSFPKPGLQVIPLRCGKPAVNAAFRICGPGGPVLSGTIRRIVERKPDGVVTGTGDMLYVNQNDRDFADFFTWYCASHIGNLLTIRPAYRWSGSRVLNPDAWKLLVPLLNQMGMRYAHMLDGRELPGISANPNAALLEGPGFLGRQLHERDGAQFYWGKQYAETENMAAEQHYDLEQRFFREQPENTYSQYSSINYASVQGRLWHYRRPDIPQDMEAAAAYSLDRLARGRYDATRHTGPSVMFKYFYQAGFEWTGAETMYTSMEPQMAFLRGAARGYNKTSIGVHHAVQWASSPHDTEERFRRYRLALYVSYIQGATEINTEEGLWHMEQWYSYHNRFGKACRGHLKQQQDFYRWVSTHSRTGSFHAPIAFLHGRLDGWHGFGANMPWGLFDIQDCDAEKSWDLLRFFYPLSRPGDTLYIPDCPVKAVGYYTGTPRGNIDALPVEADLSRFREYKVLSFLGYNRAEKEDLDRLWAYVSGGGTLVMGWPHLAVTTDRRELEQYRHHYLSHALTDYLGGTPDFTEAETPQGPLHAFAGISPAGETLEKTADGIPLIQRYSIGGGALYFINVREYPAAAAARPLYEKVLTRLSDERIRDEPCFIRCGNDVQFSIYDQDDGSRHLYVLAVDWYNEPDTPRRADLLIGGSAYELRLPFGVLLKIVVSAQAGAWALSEDGEVLSVTEDGFSAQGMGIVDFQYASGGILKTKRLDFTQEPVQHIRMG